MLKYRRFVAALLAAYSVVVASGAPLPVVWLTAWSAPARGPATSDTERFPCEACPCGCGTAEHCWADCCCHTLPQRLAWARREGVRPPTAALEAAERAGLDVREWRPAGRYVVRLPVLEAIEAPKADAATDDAAEQLAALPPCCRKRLAAQQEAICPAPPANEEDQRPAPGVSLIKAMACQGLAEAWLSLGQAPVTTGPRLVTVETVTYAVECSAPLWRHVDEGPIPPPPDRRVAVS